MTGTAEAKQPQTSKHNRVKYLMKPKATESITGSNAFSFARGALSGLGHKGKRRGSYAGGSDWSDHSHDDSCHSFKHIHKDRMFIARNNLKLNIFLNLFLMACLGLVFSLDWYCYYNESDSNVISHNFNFN